MYGMGRGNSSDQAALARARAAIGASLRARRGELEQATLAKIRQDSAVPAPDAEYVVGLREAVAAALDCGLEVLEGRSPSTAAIPTLLLLQARLAARAGIGPEVLARRYTAGHTLLDDAIVGEFAADSALNPSSLQRLLAEQGALLDRVLVLVGEEYRVEAARNERPGSRQDQLVRKLLAGDSINTAELAYEFDAWHVGVVASGPGVEPALKRLAQELDRRLLLLSSEPDGSWAWLGGQRRIGSERVRAVAAPQWPEGASLTIGEGQGLPGWRATHRQARAAVPLAQRGEQRVARYADNALLSSIVQDDLVIDSMRQLYLDPLESEADRGRDLRRTLEAYLAADRNTSSTASALGVTRKTVMARLERVEERIGRPISCCIFEVVAALALDRAIASE